MPLSVSAKTQVDYNLSLNGDLWGNPFSSTFRLDDEFRLSGMNMSMSGYGLRAEAGDISASWDQLGLAGRNFQGMKLNVPLGKVNVDLLGGNVVIQPDYIAPPDLLEESEILPVISPVYGLRASVPINRSFSLSGTQLFTPDAPENQGEKVSTLALNYLSGKHHLALEMARSQHGSGWQLSGATQSGPLRVRGNYRQAENGFSTAGNPNLRARRNGGLLHLQYRLARSLTANASLERYTDGSGGHTNYDTVNLRFHKPKVPTLSLYWRSADIKRSTPSFGIEDYATVSDTAGFRVDHTLGVDRLSFQYDRFHYQSAGTSATDRTSDRFGLGWSRPLGRQTQMSFTQALDLSRTPSGDEGRSLYTLLNLRHRVGNSGLQLDLGVQYANRYINDIAGEAVSVRTGFNYRLRSGNAVGLQYRTRLTGSGSLRSSAADRLYVSYSHRFGGGKRSASHLSLKERRKLGKIAGRVFEDSNGNGKWDQGEAGISNVTVRARGRSPQQTNENGNFSVDDIRSGDHRFEIVAKTLPIQLTTMTPTAMTVNVPAGKSAIVEFPVMRTGQAQGTVFWDKNRNGNQDEGEKGAVNIVVQVEGSDVIGFTDEQGRFNLHNLPPGKRQVAVSEVVLGEDYETTGAGSAEIVVPPNGEVDGVLLGIATKQRPIINSFEKAAL